MTLVIAIPLSIVAMLIYGVHSITADMKARRYIWAIFGLVTTVVGVSSFVLLYSVIASF